MSKISVIIPAYNEEQALPLVLRELPKGCGLDVVVVDNGSTDRTFAVAQAAQVKVAYESRRGYGQACQTGLHMIASEAEIVVFLDGDRSDFPEELPTLVEPIQRGEADLVIGSRILGQAQPGSLTLQQRLGNRLACQLIAWRFGHRFTDLGPFRAIRRSALERLKLCDRGFGWNVEMQLKALKAQLRIVEVPVRYRPRIGDSKISGTVLGTVRAGLGILGMVARHW
ncbi:MAG: glycosyltransferase family 2 protein [Candidatus Omnitrophica bacterium]|nr:glycosyltransferase family 2 protein [Candidatus Omnitrophota bacterium]